MNENTEFLCYVIVVLGALMKRYDRTHCRFFKHLETALVYTMAGMNAECIAMHFCLD